MISSLNKNPRIINIHSLFSKNYLNKKELLSKTKQIALDLYIVKDKKIAYTNIDTNTRFIISKSGINDNNVNIICKSNTNNDHINCGNIVKDICTKCQGNGGGNKNFAQGGGSNAENITKYLKNVKEIIKKA